VRQAYLLQNTNVLSDPLNDSSNSQPCLSLGKASKQPLGLIREHIKAQTAVQSPIASQRGSVTPSEGVLRPSSTNQKKQLSRVFDTMSTDPRQFEASQAIIDKKIEKIKEEQKKLKDLQVKIEQKRQEDMQKKHERDRRTKQQAVKQRTIESNKK
jgi:hypothetical protein